LCRMKGVTRFAGGVGAGIGPEVATATRRVLEAAGAPIDWVEHHAGLAALADGDEVLSESTRRACGWFRIRRASRCW
jgi:isocitrate/isopropylmalate dehydrogenase